MVKSVGSVEEATESADICIYGRKKIFLFLKKVFFNCWTKNKRHGMARAGMIMPGEIFYMRAMPCQGTGMARARQCQPGICPSMVAIQ